MQDINGEVCDALYQKLLAEGRVKAKPKTKPAAEAVHVRRMSADGKVMPCRPYGYDNARCYRKHAEDDPVIGQPITPKKLGRAAEAKSASKALPPGLDPKTVVNTHRMLHRAWEDFTLWNWASGTSSPTRTLRAFPARAARSGR